MMKSIKWYALEIYTFIALVFLLIAGLMDGNSNVQKFIMVYMLLFVFHEWEEGRYPGGFLTIIADKILCREVPEETKRGSRLPAGIMLLVITLVPFFLDNYIILVLVPVFLGLFEGLVHIIFIKIGELDRPYSPGMVTAELELATSIAAIIYFNKIGLAAGMDYVWGFLLMILCFMALQKSLFMMVGVPYRELPGIMRARIRTLRNSNKA